MANPAEKVRKPEERPRRPRGSGGLEQHPTRKGYWRGRKTVNGERLDTGYIFGKAAAGDALAGLKPNKTPDSSHTLKEAIDGYISSRNISTGTRASYEYSRDRYLVGWFDRDPSSITPYEVALLWEGMEKRGFKRSTMNGARAALAGGLQYALDRGWLEDAVNYGRAVSLPDAQSTEATEVESLDADERKRLISALKGTRFEARFLLGINLGLRPSEARGLTWSAVDFDRGTVEVTGQLQELKLKVNGKRLGLVYRRTTKTSQGRRTISPGPTIMRALRKTRARQRKERARSELGAAQIQRRKAQQERLSMAKAQGLLARSNEYVDPPYEDLCFTQANGAPLLAAADGVTWKALLKEAKVPSYPLYATRHTAFSHMIRAGVPLIEVAEVAGHRDPSFTKRVYVSKTPEVARSIARAFDDEFEIDEE